jgi:hypothetical protein
MRSLIGSDALSVKHFGSERAVRLMSQALILEFAGATPDQYNAVNTMLGIDPATGEGDWPAGLLSHVGAAASGGGVLVLEVWDARQSQESFMASSLGPALALTAARMPASRRSPAAP